MASPLVIDSIDRPELAPFRTLRRAVEHRRQGVFVAEGGVVVERLLATGVEVCSLLLSPIWLEKLAAALAARERAPAVFVAEHDLLERLVGFPLHQGVMALARIPTPQTLHAVLDGAPQPWLLLAMDDLTNSENIGTMVRSAAALGATAVIAGERCASPWLRRAVRASMGAAFTIPIVESVDLPASVAQLRRRGVTCLAATPRATVAASQVKLTADCCFVVGHEGRGVRAPVEAACSGTVAIPMRAGVDSLNVAAAAAVLLYEATRQRAAAR